MSEQKNAPVLSDLEVGKLFIAWDEKAGASYADFARAIEQAVLARVGAVRDQALEEAAAACEKVNAEADHDDEGSTDMACRFCADAIRALKGTPAAAVSEPEWIDDPHDIEQGMMRNPKYVAPSAAVADAHVAGCHECHITHDLGACPQPSSNPGPLAAVERDADRYRFLRSRAGGSNRYPHLCQYPAQDFDKVKVPQIADGPDATDAAVDAAIAASKEDSGVRDADEGSKWEGWATQKPGRLPKLFGTRQIAELNWDEDGDADLIRLVEVERIAASKEGAAT